MYLAQTRTKVVLSIKSSKKYVSDKTDNHLASVEVTFGLVYIDPLFVGSFSSFTDMRSKRDSITRTAIAVSRSFGVS